MLHAFKETRRRPRKCRRCGGSPQGAAPQSPARAGQNEKLPVEPPAWRSMFSTTMSWMFPREAQYSGTFQGMLAWKDLPKTQIPIEGGGAHVLRKISVTGGRKCSKVKKGLL